MTVYEAGVFCSALSPSVFLRGVATGPATLGVIRRHAAKTRSTTMEVDRPGGCTLYRPSTAKVGFAMTHKDLPSPEILRKILRYDPVTGKLFWRRRPVEMFADGARPAKSLCAAWNGLHAGKEAFTSSNAEGYKRSSIFGSVFQAQRVAWSIYYGERPRGEIDHENGVKSDNRIENLRDVTHRENGRNQKRKSNNVSGATGVYWHKRDERWVAYINGNRGREYLGYFTDKTAAIAARESAKKRLGYHINHGERD
jgi:hypothetical protein